jgi:threonine aldolase
MKNFASDNYSGFSPEIVDEIMKANSSYDYCYGLDKYTKIVEDEFKKLFDTDVNTSIVFNGTGANIFGLEILRRPASAVVCHDDCHILTMEAGSLGRVTGMQLMVTKSKNGKLDFEATKKLIENSKGDFHSPQPKIITIAQVSESGAVYSLEELKKISQLAKENNMYFHIDGARISNALVAMDISPKDFVKEVQPDVLVFGGTKNGLMCGEAVLVFDKNLTKDIKCIQKQILQLASKMKFISAQFIPYLQQNLWYKNAKHANDMADYFANELKKIGVELINPVDANIIFVKLPQNVIESLKKFLHFYVYDDNVCRFITSFDSEKKDIDEFVDKIRKLL